MTQAPVAVRLRLGEGMRDRHRLKRLVADLLFAADPLQVDLLGRAAVDLCDQLALGAGHDRGLADDAARVGVSDPDRPLGAQRYGNHCVGERLAVCELSRVGSAGGAAGHRDVRPRHLVGPGDRVGEVAGAGVDEEHQQFCRVAELCNRGAGSVVPSGTEVGGCIPADPQPAFDRLIEGDCDAAFVNRLIGGEDPLARHSDRRRAASRGAQLGRRSPGVVQPRREADQQPEVVVERFDRRRACLGDRIGAGGARAAG